MARHVAGTVFYPVVVPELKIIDWEEKLVRDQWGKLRTETSRMPVFRTDWKVIGRATSVEHAKQQGFRIPVLDMNYVAKSETADFEHNYI